MTQATEQQQNDTLSPPPVPPPPPLSAISSNIVTLGSILDTQKQTLHLFLSYPPTRTPTIVLYVASFGGSLHAAVTTYYYLALGATSIDIGHFGAIMSLGALLGSPVCGIALDRYRPWVPISITAVACSVGCLWRGLASSLTSLRMGAILLGVGVNLWTVVLAHLVKSFPERLRSEVLSGFAVQMTVLQLLGKGVFPLVEYALHRVVGLEDALTRYRIHMGTCTFFCFYGTFALFLDRENVIQRNHGGLAPHSDIVDELEHGNCTVTTNQSPSSDIAFKEVEMTATASSFSSNDLSIYSSYKSDRDSVECFTTDESNHTVSSSVSFINEPQEQSKHELKSTTTVLERSSNNALKKRKHLLTTITLTFALLIQSISTTVITILWPFIAVDRFNLSAHTFGILTFLSSVVSTGAVAAFPIIERLEKVGGRVRCAAWGFGVGSILCLLFCLCSFGDYYFGGVPFDTIGKVEGDTTTDSGRGLFLSEQHDATIQQEVQRRDSVALHAVTAIAFQAVLCFLEPSLKSILSLRMNLSPVSPRTSPSSTGSSLGLGMGLMNTLGNVGGILGNLAGTRMYKLSKDSTTLVRSQAHPFFEQGRQLIQSGSLPFLLTAVLMAISSILVWGLKEPTCVEAVATNIENIDRESTAMCDEDVESNRSGGNAGGGIERSSEGSEEGRRDGCCLLLRETTYDMKLD